MNPYRRCLIVLLSVVGGGCAVGPDYRRPEAAAPVAFKEAWQSASPADAVSRGPWWEAYGDPVLTDLETSAERSNQTIRQAEAQYRAAVAAVGGSRAALFPLLAASAGTTRSRSGSAQGGSAAVATTADHSSATVDWEIDLWGRLRRQLEASRTTAEASAGDLAAARLSAEATLAQDYTQLRALDVQRVLLADTLAGYRRSLAITRNRYAAGVAASTDVTQAQSQLASAEAQSADVEVQRAVLEHAIAILAGKSPEELSIAPAAHRPLLPAVPDVMPAMLLERRPDVAAAERRVAAANAAIGVARGAYFPTLSLAASGGYQGPAWHDLFSAPARVWSVGPALAATLFDGGARRAQNLSAVANYDGAVAAYRQTVLSALQAAEDALTTLRGLAIEEAAASRASLAAHDTLRATENQYRAGTVSYLNVVLAEGTVLSADTNLINVQSRRVQAHVALLKAMGGSPAR